MRRSRRPPPRRVRARGGGSSRPACSILVLVAGALLAWWAASRETRTSSYRVLGDLAGIELDLGDADVQLDGGGGAVELRRVDRFAFGHASTERRSVQDNVLRIASRCPDQVLGALPDVLPADRAGQRPGAGGDARAAACG